MGIPESEEAEVIILEEEEKEKEEKGRDGGLGRRKRVRDISAEDSPTSGVDTSRSILITHQAAFRSVVWLLWPRLQGPDY